MKHQQDTGILEKADKKSKREKIYFYMQHRSVVRETAKKAKVHMKEMY